MAASVGWAQAVKKPFSTKSLEELQPFKKESKKNVVTNGRRNGEF